jgi:hypothetical protein
MRLVITAWAQEDVSVAPTSAIERGTSSEPEPATDDSIGVGLGVAQRAGYGLA